MSKNSFRTIAIGFTILCAVSLALRDSLHRTFHNVQVRVGDWKLHTIAMGQTPGQELDGRGQPGEPGQGGRGPGGRGPGGRGPGGPGGRGGPGGPGRGNSRAATTLEAFVAKWLTMDENADGQLSSDELKDDRLKHLFKTSDKNSDGILGKEEMKLLFESTNNARMQGGGPGSRGGPGGRGGPEGRGGGQGGPGGPGGRPPRE